MKTAFSHNRGFTLVEIIVVIIVFSIAAVGVLGTYQQTMRHANDPVHNARAVKLAQAYLEEILGKRFDENGGQGGVPRCGSADAGSQLCSGAFGPDGGEGSRDLFDDVDDYDGLDIPTATDAQGNVLTGYTGYRVQVQVVNAGNELVGLNNVEAKRVDITVTTPRGYDFNFSGYRVNY